MCGEMNQIMMQESVGRQTVGTLAVYALSDTNLPQHIRSASAVHGQRLPEGKTCLDDRIQLSSHPMTAAYVVV